MTNLYSKIVKLLRDIQKPSRYIGGEFGTPAMPKSVNFNFCMVYPDVYDIGQSNQAIQILCNKANEIDGFYAQRSFLPDPKTMDVFKDNNIPMFSLETFSPLKEFDAIGITVSHDLVATNICEVLDYSQIPVFSKDRGDEDPIVFGGGPMYCNPEPYFGFFDVITIGEGEVATISALKKVRELRNLNFSRSEILKEIAKMKGMYVPLYNDGNKIVQRVIYKDFSKSDGFSTCIVPFAQIVHNRLTIEILRGCARGCRFCQAGIMYRPVRERSKENIQKSIVDGLNFTGHNEVSLTSLSSTDHSQIKSILEGLNKTLINKGIRVSIPSQRLDSFGVDMAKLVAGNKKGGLTFAIEAGSQRLRNVINKNVTEENIFNAVKYAFENGWNRAKLYFMIGLPTETDDDLKQIGILCEKILSEARKAAGEKRKHGINIAVSCAIFVPKAQTPFQKYGQISIEEARRRIKLIRANIYSRAISFSWHDSKTSMIEAVLSRGDRACNSLIYYAWKYGSRFDAWDEYFNFKAWQKAADKLGIDLQKLASCEMGGNLPWDHIDFGVDKSFFENERKKAEAEILTSDCTFGKCENCGICKNMNVRNCIAGTR